MRATKFDIIAFRKRKQVPEFAMVASLFAVCAKLRLDQNWGPSSKRKILARDNKPRVRILLKYVCRFQSAGITALATVLRHFSDSWRCVQRESARPNF
jgi:hypothetical protein